MESNTNTHQLPFGDTFRWSSIAILRVIIQRERETNLGKWSVEEFVFKRGLIDGDNVRSVIAKSHLIN